jgi:hypothetical protein
MNITKNSIVAMIWITIRRFSQKLTPESQTSAEMRRLDRYSQSSNLIPHISSLSPQIIQICHLHKNYASADRFLQSKAGRAAEANSKSEGIAGNKTILSLENNASTKVGKRIAVTINPFSKMTENQSIGHHEFIQ